VALARGAPAQPVPAATPADLAASVRTYYAMGRAGDPRNVQFLRTALRAEAEPALRLAVAECVLLSDPDGETSRRTFLEAIPQEPQVLARLFAAVEAEGSSEVPVLPSLGDLAAEGIPEALARLVELAPGAALEARLAPAVAEVVSEVAAAVPEELVAALRAASPAAQDAAVTALGAGAARSDDHAFAKALRGLAERQDELGAFSRALQPRLEAAAAARAAPAFVPAPAIVPATGTAPARAPGGG
jgi:D-alanyl-D-alanine carboxypeptidase/D-alanyl-D-alanine-endopeptidase (penicillin-binding protein 4)